MAEQLSSVRPYSGTPNTVLVLKKDTWRCFVGMEVVVSDSGSTMMPLGSVLGSATDVLTSIGWSAMKQPCTGNKLEAEIDKENADISALLHVGGLPCSPSATVNFVISVLDSPNVL